MANGTNTAIKLEQSNFASAANNGHLGSQIFWVIIMAIVKRNILNQQNLTTISSLQHCKRMITLNTALPILLLGIGVRADQTSIRYLEQSAV